MIIESAIDFYNSVLRLNELIKKVVSDIKNGEKTITISCKNYIFNLLCFINLTKYREIIADNLVNFKSRSA